MLFQPGQSSSSAADMAARSGVRRPAARDEPDRDHTDTDTHAAASRLGTRAAHDTDEDGAHAEGHHRAHAHAHTHAHGHTHKHRKHGKAVHGLSSVESAPAPEHEPEVTSSTSPSALPPVRRRHVVATLKLIALGHGGAGKTSLCNRFSAGTYEPAYRATVGMDFFPKKMAIAGKDVDVQIWDTAGQERFRSISPSMYRGMHGALLVFDVCDRASFKAVAQWMMDLQTNAGHLPMVLIGNKIDRTRERIITSEEARAKADELRLQYFETSAKTGGNVDAAFEALISQVVLKEYPTGLPDEASTSVGSARKTLDLQGGQPAATAAGSSCAC